MKPPPKPILVIIGLTLAAIGLIMNLVIHSQQQRGIPEQTGTDCDEVDGADTLALRIIHEELDARVNKYDISPSYDKNHWQPIINVERKQIAALRKWANALTEKNAKLGYLNWLAYYEDDLNDAQHELDKGPQPNPYAAEQERHEHNVQCYLDRHPFPAPPKESK